MTVRLKDLPGCCPCCRTPMYFDNAAEKVTRKGDRLTTRVVACSRCEYAREVPRETVFQVRTPR